MKSITRTRLDIYILENHEFQLEVRSSQVSMRIIFKEIAYMIFYVFTKANEFKIQLKYVAVFSKVNKLKKPTQIQMMYQNTGKNIFNFYNSRDLLPVV